MISKLILSLKKRVKHEIECFKFLKNEKQNKNIKKKIYNEQCAKDIKIEKITQSNELIQHIKIGDLVKLNSYARNRYEYNKKIYGCCGNTDICVCEKMFNHKNLTGIVIGLELPIVEVSWSNNTEGEILDFNLDVVLTN